MRPINRGPVGPTGRFYRGPIDASTSATLQATLEMYSSTWRKRKPVYNYYFPPGSQQFIPASVTKNYWQLFNNIKLNMVKSKSGEDVALTNDQEKYLPTADEDRNLKQIAESYADYRNAVESLAGGPFCAYCEAARPDTPAVEHLIPKSQFPLFTLAWANFLLGCAICNSVKGSKPARAAVVFDQQGNDRKQSECDYRNLIRTSHFLYPDEPLAYQTLIPVLHKKTGAIETPIDPLGAFSCQSHLAVDNLADKKVYGNIYTGGNPPTERCQVIVRMEAPLGLAPADAARATATAEKLVSLNREDNTSGREDYRQHRRAVFWLQTLDRIDNLEAWKRAKIRDQWDRSWNLLTTPSVETGYFSILVRILHQGGFTDYDGRFRLVDKFKQDAQANNWFPATDYTNVP